MKKFAIAFAAGALALTGIGTAAPALADPPRWAPAHGKRAHDRAERRYERRQERRYERRQARRIYDDRGRYYEPRRITRNNYMWRGNDGRYYCRRDNGTTGLVIGAGVGALAGHEIAGSGNRTLGAILGGVLGGVVGREIDRGSLNCR
ncbi:glycine zipper 2TM domain-containing protein [Erythrobacter litoralis]|uniref:glycine zipper 2TM domain-containing protein n=1 Tax=Erythrobacter litoralis TaxID=39960 RepID=UPI002434C400|nr:glycine zipper 2TM domain-containing protein [Erythrobacter litoralis]MDG6079639.1 glycine zipper 2TM domain-containing protein [Erythrobacter litoralis]